MVTAISSSVSAVPPGLSGAAGASVALQDKLTRCEQQLGDWQACPSGKTPEGKKIIQNLQSQIRNLESRIASSGSAQSAAQRNDLFQSANLLHAARITTSASATMGRSIDVFV